MGCAQAEISVMLELIKKRLCRECPRCCDTITAILDPIKELGMEEIKIRLGL